MMTKQANVDEDRLERFMEKVVGDLSGAMTTIMCSIGDSLGLFKSIDAEGPATSEELALRTGINERYAREWLGGMLSAGYLDYDATTGRYALPPEHAPALADEGGPMFVGGVYEQIPPLLTQLDHLLQAFRDGGGVHQSAYCQRWWEGMARFTGTWFGNLLVQEWLPMVPELQSKLEQGVMAADIGCGCGHAVLKLAEAFPNSRFVGYDVYEPNLEEAREKAEAAGVNDRVAFKQHDVVQGLPEQYDLITTFDVIHDMADPQSALHAIRNGLQSNGTYLLLEINCADRKEDNTGPIASIFYGYSMLYCMTTSLANGGAGLGTLGMPEARVREYCAEAGFSEVRRLPLDNPFNILYEVKA